MRVYRLQRNQVLPTTLQKAWDFFSDPRNLARITPPWLGFTITSATPPMVPGLILTYTVTPLFGLRRTWVSEITHAQPPHSFVDEQRFGPYRFWHHLHRFHQLDGQVAVEDVVHYALPFGLPGRFVHRRLVRPRLEAIFDYRREALKALFPAADASIGHRRTDSPPARPAAVRHPAAT